MKENNIEKIKQLNAIKTYLSKNRSEYGTNTKLINNSNKTNTLYGNIFGKFGMTDGNSIYVLNNKYNEVLEELDVPSTAIESNQLFKIYDNIHAKINSNLYSSKIHSLNPIIDQAIEEGLLSTELLDSINIKDKELTYYISLEVFKKKDTLFFSKEQIDLYKKLLGTETTDYRSWIDNILYGTSQKGHTYIYTKKNIKK